MEKVVVVHSGGLDSTVLLYWLINKGHEVRSVGFDYGQKHQKELAAAAIVCSALHIPRFLMTIRPPLKGSALTDPDMTVPEGHYESENMRITVVPNRNMIMLALAVGYAISEGFGVVAYAAHRGDHVIYPDCRAEFRTAMQEVFNLCHFTPLKLEAPFVSYTKVEIVKIGADLKVPFSLTWSCYKGGSTHCGKCGTCVERKEAFRLAGVADPTHYSG